MGFGTDEREFTIGVSDTQAYKQFGNAVVVPVVAFLANALRKHIEAAVASKSTATKKQKALIVTRPDRPEAVTAHG
jgi:DNA (cytosine-5)-methyltransferase 1